MVGKFRKQTQLSNYAAKTNISAPTESKIGEHVSGLLSFAGAGVGVVTNYMNEKTQKDITEQTNRYAVGLLPSEDATTAGYRAAKALAFENEMSVYKAELEAGAAQEMDDAEWTQFQLNKQKEARDRVNARFPQLADDEQLNTLADMGFINTIPAVTFARKANELKRQEAAAFDEAGAWVLGNANLPDEEFTQQLHEISNGIGLSEGRSEELLTKLAQQSRNPVLIEKLTRMKDSKGVPLTDKYGVINSLDKEVRRERAAEDADLIADAKEELTRQFATGQITSSQLQSSINRFNQKYGGAFMSQHEAETFHRKGAEQYQEYTRIEDITDSVLGGNPTEIATKDKPVISTSTMNANLKMLASKYSEEDLNKPEVQSQIYNQAVNRTSQQLIRQGVVNDKWKTDFVAVSSMDVNTLLIKDEETGRELLTQDARKALNTWEALPDDLKPRYADEKTAATLNKYSDFVEKVGEAHVGQAIRRAKEASREPYYNPNEDAEVNKKAKDFVKSKFDRYFFEPGEDLPEANSAWVEARVQDMVRAGYTDTTIEKWLDTQTFHTREGHVIMASPTELKARFGVETDDRIDDVFEYAKEARREKIEEALSYLGGDYNQAFWDVDVDTGNAVLRNPDGWPIAGTAIPLNELSGEWKSEKYGNFKKEGTPEGFDVDNSSIYTSIY